MKTISSKTLALSLLVGISLSGTSAMAELEQAELEQAKLGIAELGSKYHPGWMRVVTTRGYPAAASWLKNQYVKNGTHTPGELGCSTVGPRPC